LKFDKSAKKAETDEEKEKKEKEEEEKKKQEQEKKAQPVGDDGEVEAENIDEKDTDEKIDE